ncbi:MAG: hypothetical protein V8S72_06780 [Oscillospiraceae bacterium]
MNGTVIGPGGDSAGVKGDAEKVTIRECGEHKNQRIAHDEYPPERRAGEDAEHTYRHEKPDSRADGHEQDAAFDMRHGLSQNLHVRLRDSDGEAEQKADAEYQRHILCSGQRRADPAADGRHGLLCAEGKQPHSNDQHHRAYQKAQQQIGRIGVTMRHSRSTMTAMGSADSAASTIFSLTAVLFFSS